jgi:hypothetical protein
MKKIIGILIMILLITSSIQVLGAINKNTYNELSSSAEWTILVLMDGDNDLEEAMVESFIRMSSAGSTNLVNIVAEFDRIPGFCDDYDDWNTTKRYLISKDMEPNIANAIEDIGEKNMGDPQTVIDFVNWGIANYPANNYFLIFSDHGYGWKSSCDLDVIKHISFENTNYDSLLKEEDYAYNGINFYDPDVVKHVCIDFTDDDSLSLDEWVNALDVVTNEGDNPFDIIGFDACLMQMIDIAYEIVDYGRYMTASEAVEPLAGWYYDLFLPRLIEDPYMSPETLGFHVVDTFEGPTLSTIDLGLIHELIDEVNALGITLQDEKNKDIIKGCAKAKSYNDPDYRDLYDFAYRLIKYKDNLEEPDDIINQAQEVITKVNETVTSMKNIGSRSHGISIYLPVDAFRTQYEELLIAIDTQWDEFLKWLCEEQTSNPPQPPIVNGPKSGKRREDIEFTIVATDPDNDDLYYRIRWGDGNYTYSGPYASGEEIIIEYNWSKPGTYWVSIQAIDTYDEKSKPTLHLISIEKNNPYINRPILNFLQQHPNLFPLLQRLLKL